MGIDTFRLFQEWRKESPRERRINSRILLVGMSATAQIDEQDEAFKYGTTPNVCMTFCVTRSSPWSQIVTRPRQSSAFSGNHS